MPLKVDMGFDFYMGSSSWISRLLRFTSPDSTRMLKPPSVSKSLKPTLNIQRSLTYTSERSLRTISAAPVITFRMYPIWLVERAG